MSECPKCRKGLVRTRYSPTNHNRLRSECLVKTCLGCGYSWEEEPEDARELLNER